MKLLTVLRFIIIIGIPIMFSCSNEYEAQIIATNLITCFPDSLTYEDSSLVTCEASGVIYRDGILYIVNDKPIPKHSSIFTVKFEGDTISSQIEWLDNPKIYNAVKFEDITISPNDNLIFVITAFDRILPTNRWDIYNVLLCWKINSLSHVQIISETDNNGIKSSVGLRKYIQAALVDKRFMAGAPYYKIEGLTVIPNRRLLLGIREMGARHDDYNYVIKMLGVDYNIIGDSVVLTHNFAMDYEFDATTEKRIEQPIGLSAIEYDQFNNRIYLLTSFELKDQNPAIGAYLWILSMTDFQQNNPPKLVLNNQNEPLLFKNKAEGIAPIDKQTVFIIHDDDRYTNNNPATPRTLNQAVYEIVKIK